MLNRGNDAASPMLERGRDKRAILIGLLVQSGIVFLLLNQHLLFAPLPEPVQLDRPVVIGLLMVSSAVTGAIVGLVSQSFGSEQAEAVIGVTLGFILGYGIDGAWERLLTPGALRWRFDILFVVFFLGLAVVFLLYPIFVGLAALGATVAREFRGDWWDDLLGEPW